MYTCKNAFKMHALKKEKVPTDYHVYTRPLYEVELVKRVYLYILVHIWHIKELNAEVVNFMT